MINLKNASKWIRHMAYVRAKIRTGYVVFIVSSSPLKSGIVRVWNSKKSVTLTSGITDSELEITDQMIYEYTK